MKIPKVSIEEFFTLPEDEQVYLWRYAGTERSTFQ